MPNESACYICEKIKPDSEITELHDDECKWRLQICKECCEKYCMDVEQE